MARSRFFVRIATAFSSMVGAGIFSLRHSLQQLDGIAPDDKSGTKKNAGALSVRETPCDLPPRKM